MCRACSTFRLTSPPPRRRPANPSNRLAAVLRHDRARRRRARPLGGWRRLLRPEDTAVALAGLSAALVDPDGSETLTGLTIQGVPTGGRFVDSSGAPMASISAAASWSFQPADLAAIRFIAPEHVADVFDMRLVANLARGCERRHRDVHRAFPRGHDACSRCAFAGQRRRLLLRRRGCAGRAGRLSAALCRPRRFGDAGERPPRRRAARRPLPRRRRQIRSASISAAVSGASPRLSSRACASIPPANAHGVFAMTLEAVSRETATGANRHHHGAAHRHGRGRGGHAFRSRHAVAHRTRINPSSSARRSPTA